MNEVRVNGEIEPYVVIRAPAILSRSQHQRWIRDRCEDLRARGYVFFRASFPDERPEELYVEGWTERPREIGPCPWESVQAPPPSGSAEGDDGLRLLDGSAVPRDPSYKRKRPDGQQASYVVFSDRRLAGSPQVRPHQRGIRHMRCGTLTELHDKIAATLARDPKFYGAMYCAHCRAHFRIGAEGEFLWNRSDQKVGT